MNNKIIFLSVLLIFSALFFPAFVLSFEYDYGGTFLNSTDFVSDETSSDTEIEQLNRLALLFEAYNESESGNETTFTAQGSYEYTDERAYLFNIDMLSIRGTFPGAVGSDSVFEAEGGRIYFSDPTEIVLSHTADGISFKFLYPGIRYFVEAGYTGLLLNPSSDIRMTSLDMSEESLETDDTFFGPAKAFLQSTITVPELWWLDSMSFFGLAVFDLRDESEGPVMHTQYLGFNSSRSYGKNMYQNLFFILQHASLKVPDIDDRNAIGLIFGLKLNYLKESFFGSNWQFKLIGAPPDVSIDDLIDVPFGVLGFVPMSKPDLANSVSPTLSGLGLLELKYSFRPFINSSSETASAIQPYTAARGFFRTYSVSVDWIDTDTESDGLYIGTEIEAGLVWRIFSDLGLELNGAYFLPATGGFGAASDNMESIFAFRTSLSVSF